MKEFNYSKWNNKPREMWVWDFESMMEKKFVTYTRNDNSRRVLFIDNSVGPGTRWYSHCAEIEPTHRMTNYELAHWLWEGTQVGEFREYKMGIGCFTELEYEFDDENRTVDEDIKIRVNGGEWKEPIIEE